MAVKATGGIAGIGGIDLVPRSSLASCTVTMLSAVLEALFSRRISCRADTSFSRRPLAGFSADFVTESFAIAGWAANLCCQP